MWPTDTLCSRTSPCSERRFPLPSGHHLQLLAMTSGVKWAPDSSLYNQENGGTSLVDQWLRLCASVTGGTGSIPGQGTKIPHATQSGKKKKKGREMVKLSSQYLWTRRPWSSGCSPSWEHPSSPPSLISFWKDWFMSITSLCFDRCSALQPKWMGSGGQTEPAVSCAELTESRHPWYSPAQRYTPCPFWEGRDFYSSLDFEAEGRHHDKLPHPPC